MTFDSAAILNCGKLYSKVKVVIVALNKRNVPIAHKNIMMLVKGYTTTGSLIPIILTIE
jgi:hypothetical protein